MACGFESLASSAMVMHVFTQPIMYKSMIIVMWEEFLPRVDPMFISISLKPCVSTPCCLHRSPTLPKGPGHPCQSAISNVVKTMTDRRSLLRAPGRPELALMTVIKVI